MRHFDGRNGNILQRFVRISDYIVHKQLEVKSENIELKVEETEKKKKSAETGSWRNQQIDLIELENNWRAADDMVWICLLKMLIGGEDEQWTSRCLAENLIVILTTRDRLKEFLYS